MSFEVLKDALLDSKCDDVMVWVQNPYYQDEASNVKVDYIEDNNGNMVKHVTILFDGLSDEYAPIMENLNEWSRLVTELSRKEIELYNKKEDYNTSSEKLLEDAAKEKAETDYDVIKEKYGGNNDKTRKKYVKDSLADEAMELKQLEWSIDYIKRRISFLKQLIHTKTILKEVKE